MASTSFPRNVVPLAVDDKEPVIINGSEFVSEPAVTAVEGTIWGEELMIPHKLEKPEKDTEVPPVEHQSTTNVEAPTIETPAPRQEKTSSCSHDLGAKDGNEEDANTTVNDEKIWPKMSEPMVSRPI
ncbi:hypothetical protein P8452_39521 [Trifolium repens]|nr:hypothetical protein P8452_39521 [Trifolium repens]